MALWHKVRKNLDYTVSVVGLGKIGLPLAVQFASVGHRVIGCDVNEQVVELVSSGVPTFSGEPELDALLRQSVQQGRFTATVNTEEAVSLSNVVVVVVPLLVDNEGSPKFEALDAATHSVGRGLRPGTLVVFETTLPVGVTRDRLTPALEAAAGLKAGVDFFVAFSPERVYSGKVFANFREYPKLVGGIDAASGKRAVDFYSRSFDFEARQDLSRPNGAWDLGSSEAAELAKLAETTYRDVNIALANQFAKFAESKSVDIYQVIEACNSQPYSHIHQPGVAVGGHCIPVYPQMYLLGDPEADLVRVARETNRSMPEHLLEGLERQLGSFDGKRIAVLGLSYRGGVKEHAFSGAWDLVKGIERRGGTPLVHDPLWDSEELLKLGLTPYTLGDHCDAAILQASHDMYRNLSKEELGGASVFADGRNFMKGAPLTGSRTISLGRPASE